jgi:hypothetical protein
LLITEKFTATKYFPSLVGASGDVGADKKRRPLLEAQGVWFKGRLAWLSDAQDSLF